jgi:O-antigen/teichoic acid export membrane protein
MTARRNLVIAFVQKSLQMVAGVVSVLVLARLVSPTETGIFSTGVAIAALTHAVRDFGVGNFLIKETEPSAEKVRTAFTISLLIAVVLSVVLFAVAGPAARFYGQPEVATVVVISTAGLLISPFSTVNLALLLRDHRFLDMFKISVSGNFASIAVSILFAWWGYGATALALGALANSVGLVVVSNLVLPRWGDYLPTLAHWRPIWRFGMHSTVSGLSEQIGGRVTDLVIGKTIGFDAVGILSRSGSIITMFNETIITPTTSVVMAGMASDARRGAGVSAMLLTVIEYATVIAWPFLAVLAIFSRDAVLVLFGEQWVAAAPYTSILSYGAMIGILLPFISIAVTAAGRVDRLSRYNLASQGVRVALIALGALWSLRAVAILMVVAAVLQCGFAALFLRAVLPVSAAELWRRVWRSVAVSAIVLAAVVPLDQFAEGSALHRVLLVALVATPAWLAGLFLVRHPATALITGALLRVAGLLGGLVPPKFRER